MCVQSGYGWVIEDMLIHCKRSAFQSWIKSVKRIVNLYAKRYANPFEINESVISLAAPEFLLTDLDHDDNKHDGI